MGFLYKFEPERGGVWARLFAERAPDVEFGIWPDIGDPSAVGYLAAWEPPENLAETFPNLELVFSVGAGVNQFDLSRIPPETRGAHDRGGARGWHGGVRDARRAGRASRLADLRRAAAGGGVKPDPRAHRGLAPGRRAGRGRAGPGDARNTAGLRLPVRGLEPDGA